MKIKTLCKWMAFGLASLLAACATLTPLWSIVFENGGYVGRVYASGDGNSAYVVKLDTAGGRSSLDHYNLDGQLMETLDLPDSTGFSRYAQVYPTDDNSFYLIPGFSTGGMASFVSPQEGVRWQTVDTSAFPDLGSITLIFGIVNAANDLIVSARIQQPRDDGSTAYLRAVGSINPQGVLTRLYTFDNLTSLVLRNDFRDGHFYVLTQRSNPQADDPQSELITFDNALNLESRVELAPSFYNIYAIKDHLVAINAQTSQQTLIAADGTLTPIPLHDYGGRVIAGRNSFYEISHDFSGNAAAIVCNYGYDLQQRWCRNSTMVDNDSWNRHVEVNADDELELSMESDAYSFSGTTGSVSGDETGVTGGLSVSGRQTYKTGHQIFSPDGETRLLASATPFIQRSTSHVCEDRLERCVDVETVQPGACTIMDAVFLPGDRVLSLAGYCTDDTKPSALQLALWGKP